MTDVLGVLETFDESALTIRPDSGDVVTIERSLIVTGKPVPPRASTRLRISPEQLERICEQGWRATTEQPLGGWTLRAAAGFTGRANSARVGGDPGLEADAAVAAVVEFYAGRGLPPMVQVVLDSAWQVEFEGRGWRRPHPDGQDVLVQVASVAQALRLARARRAASSPRPDVAIHGVLTDDWMTLYGRTAGLDPEVVRAVMDSGDEVAFAQIGDPVVAIGRAVVTGDWMGLQAVEVAEAHRRRGLAGYVVDALFDWGASRGALSAYLQTGTDNTAALRLYELYGFATHHVYRYLSPAEASNA